MNWYTTLKKIFGTVEKGVATAQNAVGRFVVEAHELLTTTPKKRTTTRKKGAEDPRAKRKLKRGKDGKFIKAVRKTVRG